MNPPARLLLINGRFLDGPRGAVNAVARDLALALDAATRAPGAGWRVELVVPPGLAEAARDTGLAVRVHGHGKGLSWEQRDLPALRHTGVVAGFFNTVPLRGRGYVSLLHDAHVFTTPDSYGRATALWRRLLARRAGARGNHVLTVSGYARDALLRAGVGAPGRIGVVPNGLGAVARVAPDTSILDRLGLDGAAPHCVALASLLPHKNIAVLLRAFADPALSGMRLVLVGATPREDFLRAGLSAGSNLLFPGFVSDAELAALYASALAVCMPSTEEGFGLPALEGMAHGAPAVIAPRGALPEVVGDTGLVAAANDPEAWVTVLHRLAEAPELRARLSEAARRRAAAFTWEASAGAVLAHLDRWYPR